MDVIASSSFSSLSSRFVSTVAELSSWNDVGRALMTIRSRLDPNHGPPSFLDRFTLQACEGRRRRRDAFGPTFGQSLDIPRNQNRRSI